MERLQTGKLKVQEVETFGLVYWLFPEEMSLQLRQLIIGLMLGLEDLTSSLQDR